MDSSYRIKRLNQPPIDVATAPWQHLAPLVGEMCTKNRTTVANGKREETVDLEEIDKIATRGKTNDLDEADRQILDIVRTGSSWNRVAAYWSGQAEDKQCVLCQAGDEGPTHFWSCPALEEARRRADSALSEIPPDVLPNPIKVGIAPAMSCCPGGLFWMHTPPEGMTGDQAVLCGQNGDRQFDEPVAQLLEQSKDFTAREVMQNLVSQGDRCNAPINNKRIEQLPPPEPNVFPDGSVINPRSLHWQIGGMGLWWPDRNEDSQPRNDAERTLANAVQETHGMSMFNNMTNLSNSSTRCEIGGIITAAASDVAINAGSDSLSAVRKGNTIIQHLRGKERTELYNAQGGMILGGEEGEFHRPSPFKRAWGLMKDGDLWENFTNMVKARGPSSIELTKVKGHTTADMCRQGLESWDNKFGNDKADRAADAGVAVIGGNVLKVASYFAERHEAYRNFMSRIHAYIIAVRREEGGVQELPNVGNDQY